MDQLEPLRTKTGELLDEAARGGMLTVTEHRWRRENLSRAQSVSELDALVQDLLDLPEAEAGASPAVRGAPLVTLLAERVFTSSDLVGSAEVTTVLGTSRVDLQGWNPGQELVLEVSTVLGETTIEVPEGCSVRVEATPVLGECHVAPGLSAPGAPVRIRGSIVLGTLRVVPARHSVT